MSETSYHLRAWALAHYIMKLFYCSLFSPQGRIASNPLEEHDESRNS
jgi:hypothetical protein